MDFSLPFISSASEPRNHLTSSLRKPNQSLKIMAQQFQKVPVQRQRLRLIFARLNARVLWLKDKYHFSSCMILRSRSLVDVTILTKNPTFAATTAVAFGIGHAHYYGTRDTHYIREKVDSMAIQLMKVDETVHGVANGPDKRTSGSD